MGTFQTIDVELVDPQKKQTAEARYLSWPELSKSGCLARQPGQLEGISIIRS